MRMAPQRDRQACRLSRVSVSCSQGGSLLTRAEHLHLGVVTCPDSSELTPNHTRLPDLHVTNPDHAISPVYFIPSA